MSFLSPMSIAIAAGITVPPLIALYFLKLKRNVRLVPSTLLWKKSVEDLHVNAPFQRLRSSLLLLLQLMILALAALALGKPMFEVAQSNESTIIVLIDQSASMAVMEEGGRTRLDLAKDEAKRIVDGMEEDSRAMVIAFCDRAPVVSSFDTDRESLKRKIDSIEQTESSSSLGEAMSLAEAYTQNIIIGSEEAGADRLPDSIAPPASVYVLTDGRVEDAATVTLQKFDLEKINVRRIGSRQDNVGIVAMDARRNYESPDMLEVSATVENFGSDAVTLDAVLYVNGDNLDVQTMHLGPTSQSNETGGMGRDKQDSGGAGAESIHVVAFENIEFAGSGAVEVALHVDDALSADNRAWAIVQAPRHVRVLLVTTGNWFLERILRRLPLELVIMTPGEYESAAERDIQDGDRSVFDVVMIDDHSTSRLPQGNYFFWGGGPELEGVVVGDPIRDEVIFNWDETHPILRYVAVESLFVFQWNRLALPQEAISIIDGQSSPVLGALSRNGSHYMISAFSIIAHDDDGIPLMNTNWVTSLDFVVFTQNTIQFLSGSTSTEAQRSVRPGEPVTVPIPAKLVECKIHRPDGVIDRVPAAGFDSVHYARTRKVGTFRLDPAQPGHEFFAVNLFNHVESTVAPSNSLALGAGVVEAQAGALQVNKAGWPLILIALLAVLLIEWVVYNLRVFI